MESFWHWARKAARTGRIDADQWEDAADAIGYTAPAVELRRVLVEAGLVDVMAGGWDYIHDWHQHADKTVREALEYNGQVFANGQETRKWKKGSCGKVAEKVSEVAEKPKSVTPSARARPEPEPEPEPESDGRKGSGDSETGEGAEATDRPTPLAKFLHEHTAQPLPPDGEIEQRVLAALGSVPLVEFASHVARRRLRATTYGYWLPVAAEFARRWRSKAPPASPPARCEKCAGTGRVFGGTNDEFRALVLSNRPDVDEEFKQRMVPCECSSELVGAA